MKKTLFLILLAMGLISQPVSAEIASGNFVGISYNQQHIDGEIDGQQYPGDINPLDAIFLRYGFYLFRFVAVEFHAGFSLKTINSNNTMEGQLDYMGAAFGRLNFPFETKKVNFYVMGGTAVGSYSADTGNQNSGEVSETKAGLSYGAGVEVYANEDTGMNIEWIRYLHFDDFSAGGISLGIVHHFRFGDLFK